MKRDQLKEPGLEESVINKIMDLMEQILRRLSMRKIPRIIN